MTFLVVSAANRLSSSAHAGVLASAISSCSSPSRVTLPGVLLWAQERLPLSMLIDSSVDDSFIAESFARQHSHLNL